MSTDTSPNEKQGVGRGLLPLVHTGIDSAGASGLYRGARVGELRALATRVERVYMRGAGRGLVCEYGLARD